MQRGRNHAPGELSWAPLEAATAGVAQNYNSSGVTDDRGCTMISGDGRLPGVWVAEPHVECIVMRFAAPWPEQQHAKLEQTLLVERFQATNDGDATWVAESFTLRWVQDSNGQRQTAFFLSWLWAWVEPLGDGGALHLTIHKSLGCALH